MNIEWNRAELIAYVSNQSAYVAQSLAMGGEVAFDATTLTNDNKATLLDEKIADAVNALVPHFARIITDDAQMAVGENVGFSFTPRIDGGSYSQAEFSHIKTLCKKLVASYILTDWYSLKGIAAMSGYFASQYAQTSTELDVALDRFVRPVRKKGVSIRSVTDESTSEKKTLWLGEIGELSITVGPIEGKPLSEHTFDIEVFTNPTKVVKISSITKKEGGMCNFLLTTEEVGVGVITCIVTVHLDDGRVSICKIESDISIKDPYQ